mmetsp:Transcript_63873/g.93521  ORF Transcript_63873/g.93521 Transcript_63873/m.93521 type:complete len:83 (+) Transcript_63873:199-447(+)
MSVMLAQAAAATLFAHAPVSLVLATAAGGLFATLMLHIHSLPEQRGNQREHCLPDTFTAPTLLVAPCTHNTTRITVHTHTTP